MRHPRQVTLPHHNREESGSRRDGVAFLQALPREVLADLRESHDMHRRIQRERQLCDRGRPPFSVVVFDVGNPALDAGPAVRLVQVFRHRARLSDEIGWFGRTRIAVLLPVTPHAGAHELAVDLTSLLATNGDNVGFRVICL